MYAIFSPKEKILYHTMSEYKSISIKTFLKEIEMTWNEARKFGWSCSKVDVTVVRHRDFRKEFRSL